MRPFGFRRTTGGGRGCGDGFTMMLLLLLSKYQNGSNIDSVSRGESRVGIDCKMRSSMMWEHGSPKLLIRFFWHGRFASGFRITSAAFLYSCKTLNFAVWVTFCKSEKR